MADGEPVTQKQFYDGQKEILVAVGKVNESVQDMRVDVGKVETKLDTHEKRMDKQDDRIGVQDEKIDDQKKWNRGLAAVEGLIATGLAYLGIRLGD